MRSLGVFHASRQKTFAGSFRNFRSSRPDRGAKK